VKNNLKDSKSEMRVAEIIEATFRCISEKGYGNLTMNAIAEYAKMSKGAINHYFKKKEDILVAVLKELDRRLFKIVDDKIKGLDQNARGPKSVEDLVRYRLQGSFELTKENPALMYVLADFIALSRKDERYRSIIQHFFKKYRYLSSIGVKRGIENKVFKNVNLEHMGIFLWGSFIGLGMQWVLDEGSFDYDAVIQITNDMVLDYLKEKPLWYGN
jgi:AcrR family transcriptional regulator